MSGLFGSLNQSVSALSAHSRGIETAGRNLSNVNNPNYSRQRVLMGDRGTVVTPNGAQSLGIEAKAIQQLRDALMDTQVVREISLSSSARAGMNGFAKAQAALGETIDRTAAMDGGTSATGLDVAIADFFNGFNAFAAQPTDHGTRQTLVQRAALLAERFRLTDQRLDQVQQNLTYEANADAQEINRITSSIAELNNQISRFELTAPGSAVDLRDQRQAKLEELAAKISFETEPSTGAAGSINVFVRDANGDPLNLVTRSTPAAVAFDGNSVTVGGTAVALSGGSIHGALAARDGAVQDVRDRLDAMARQLVVSVNAAYNPDNTGNFFDPATTGAGSIRLDPALTAANLKASVNNVAGDNDIAVAVAAVGQHRFAVTGGDEFDGTFAQYYSGVVSDLGQAVASSRSRFEDQSTIESLVRRQRDSVSGVSLDEEMADLLKFQRAFQASARVFSVIDDLLNTVVNRLGA
jgi:flagellar hook-associated protein 1